MTGKLEIDWFMGCHQALLKERAHGFAATGSRPDLHIAEGLLWGKQKRTICGKPAFSVGQVYKSPPSPHLVRGTVIPQQPVGETRAGKAQILKIWDLLHPFPHGTSHDQLKSTQALPSFSFSTLLEFLIYASFNLQEREDGRITASGYSVLGFKS